MNNRICFGNTVPGKWGAYVLHTGYRSTQRTHWT